MGNKQELIQERMRERLVMFFGFCSSSQTKIPCQLESSGAPTEPTERMLHQSLLRARKALSVFYRRTPRPSQGAPRRMSSDDASDWELTR